MVFLPAKLYFIEEKVRQVIPIIILWPVRPRSRNPIENRNENWRVLGWTGWLEPVRKKKKTSGPALVRARLMYASYLGPEFSTLRCHMIVRTYGRTDLEPNTFPPDPPAQSISKYCTAYWKAFYTVNSSTQLSNVQYCVCIWVHAFLHIKKNEGGQWTCNWPPLNNTQRL